jgi:hypothetical protein
VLGGVLLLTAEVGEEEVDILDVIFLTEFHEFRCVFHFYASRSSHSQEAPADKKVGLSDMQFLHAYYE